MAHSNLQPEFLLLDKDFNLKISDWCMAGRNHTCLFSSLLVSSCVVASLVAVQTSPTNIGGTRYSWSNSQSRELSSSQPHCKSSISRRDLSQQLGSHSHDEVPTPHRCPPPALGKHPRPCSAMHPKGVWIFCHNGNIIHK